MKTTLSIIIYCLIALSTSAQNRFPKENEIIVINDSTFVEAGKVYMDLIEVDLEKTFYKKSNVESTVTKRGNIAKILSGTPSAVLITRKTKYDFISLDLLINDIKIRSDKDLQDAEVYIDNKKIKDTEDAIIELHPEIELNIVEVEKNGIQRNGLPIVPQIRILINNPEDIPSRKKN